MRRPLPPVTTDFEIGGEHLVLVLTASNIEGERVEAIMAGMGCVSLGWCYYVAGNAASVWRVPPGWQEPDWRAAPPAKGWWAATSPRRQLAVIFGGSFAVYLLALLLAG